MKIRIYLKYILSLLGSLAVVTTQADAKPDKGNSGDKDKKEHSDKGKDDKGKDDKGKDDKGKDDKGKDDKGRDHDGKGDKDKDDKNAKHRKFEDRDRDEIVGYFGRYRTQGDGLPPGLAMNLRRGKELPPGWQNKLVPGYRFNDDEWLSYALVPSGWFPNQRMDANTRLYHYGDRVVRVYEPNREVIDVITIPSGR